MIHLVWLIPALPLAGFLVLVFGGRRLGEPLAGWLASLCTAGSFVATLLVYFGLLQRHGEERQYQQVLFSWISVGGLHIDLGFLVDPLSITMALFVTGVATVIHVYSVGYMRGDPKFSKFFVYLNLFVFSMLMLVLGNNLVVTFLGWEGVGACSYFLISFWFTREGTASAGKKAFVTNRVGDFGFMLGTFLVFTTIGSLNFVDLNAGAKGIAEGTATAIVLLMFLGAVGKSAQLPLAVWLPDAMAGPTPVSALIHAATMVTAGVYLLCRLNPVLAVAPDARWTIAIVGAVTAVLAAAVACVQYDIKRVLAYSTVSQLGYMVLAIGSGAYVAAIFHMIMHAFFKALLFLGSGSVIHGMHDEQDMRRMGGLRKLMPITAITFMVGWLAIAGVPPFAGFWSKGDILDAAWNKSVVLWAIGLLTALLTAYYMSRQVFLVFFGERRWEEADDHGQEVRPHESPAVMWAPLVVLAVLSTIGGIINLPVADKAKVLEHFLDPVVGASEVHLDLSTAAKVLLDVVAVAGSLLAIGFAYLAWIRHRVAERVLEPEVLEKAWYLDIGLAWFFGHPARDGADFLTGPVDHGVIDGAVNGVATVVRRGAGQLRKLQTGYVRNYALGVAAGAVLLLAWFTSRAAL